MPESEANAVDAPDEPSSVCTFFRKPSKGKNIRKRSVTVQEGEDEDSKSESSVVITRKKPATVDNKLRFSTGPLTTLKDPDPNKAKATVFEYESSKEIQVQNDSRATATLETETEFSKDARAVRERVLRQAEDALKGKSKSDKGEEKLYKGIHGYTDYKAGFRREQTVASEKAGGAHGPLRASAHIRVSARFDYQPDICKDYKETGYCGYGDSCKFMHDRGDYKSGWQLEKEWEEKEKERARKLFMGMKDEDEGGAEDEEDEDSQLPFACLICRESFVDPVVTRCKHYFCEHCALKHHAKNKKCFVCNQPTNGIFNTAFEIRKKIAPKQ
ncbi:hypothetical protein M569_15875 [Genlisea aurea]|uniref:Zinc finger CCCH domain-containing protein 1 n=1 Tax=Genlisea aurea TaxID=192259 RepID=S8BWH7_9LAMI|nr:hypothetical protein M569_15875 [Genlisea aurea]